MIYRILLKDGSLLGKYDGKSPKEVATRIIRTLYKKTGSTTKDIKFINTETKKIYSYLGKITILKEPIIKKIGNNIITQKYKISVERI
jgi:hypothetical protein